MSRKNHRSATKPLRRTSGANPAIFASSAPITAPNPAVPASPAASPIPSDPASPKPSPVSATDVLSSLFSFSGNPLYHRFFARDGYSNPAAFLGDSSPLSAAGTFNRFHLTARPELLTTTYREDWLAKKIIDMPSEDMTRAWYSLTTSMSEEDLKRLRRLEARHSVRQELTNAIRWARLYGGSLAVMIIRGEENILDQPLELDVLTPGSFEGLLVLDRSQGIEPSLDLVKNLEDPDYGEPEYYTVSVDSGPVSSIRIHHSRVLTFIGRELPRTEAIAENHWGASELEHIWEELRKRSETSANIAALVYRANISTLKMADFGTDMAMGSDRARERILNALESENRLRTSFGLQILGKDDEMQTHSYSFSGLSEIYENFMMDMAGASGIPATRLFGRSPQGMNATGESDMRNYYDMISELQERMLRPALEKLLPVMAISSWGFCPDDLDIVFNPINPATPAERADLLQKLSSDVISAYQANLITRAEAVQELKSRGLPLSAWSRLPDDDPRGDRFASQLQGDILREASGTAQRPNIDPCIRRG